MEGTQSLKLDEDDEELVGCEEELGNAAGVGRVTAPMTWEGSSAGSGACTNSGVVALQGAGAGVELDSAAGVSSSLTGLGAGLDATASLTWAGSGADLTAMASSTAASSGVELIVMGWLPAAGSGADLLAMATLPLAAMKVLAAESTAVINSRWRRVAPLREEMNDVDADAREVRNSRGAGPVLPRQLTSK